jgi:tetratricopeptide (TPR) repeat protein
VVAILLAVRVAPTAPAEYYSERTRAILSDAQRIVDPNLNRQLEDLARRGLEWDRHNVELNFALEEALSTLADLTDDPHEREAYFAKAVESARQALADAPGDVRLVRVLGTNLDSLGRFSESDPLFMRALELDPKGGPTHNTVGFHLLAEGKYAEAQAQFRLGGQYGAGEVSRVGLGRIDEVLNGKGNAPAAPPGGS